MSEYIKFWNIKRKYGLSKIDYNNLLEKQKYNCSVCGNSLSTNKTKIHVDHCHKTGKVRGILHQECNILLGYSKENIELLKKVIRYIKKHNRSKLTKRKKCDCHLYEQQVCDICQKVSGKEKDKKISYGKRKI